jgi:hypothetical protein
MSEETTLHRGRGIGVDASGGPVIDPTANVRELVLAESKYQDGMREASIGQFKSLSESLQALFLSKHSQLDDKLNAVEKVFDDRMKEAETNRNDALKQAAKNIQDGLDKAERLLTTALAAAEQRVNDKLEARFSNMEKLYQEKFHSIEVQFAERDVRSEQTGKDNKIALDAALQAAEKAVGAKNQSNDLAIAKSEGSMTKQIEQLQVMIATKDQASTEKISDLKDRLISTDGELKNRLSTLDGRLATIEGRGVGVEQSKKSGHDQTSLIFAGGALLVAIVVAASAMFRPAPVVGYAGSPPSITAH